MGAPGGTQEEDVTPGYGDRLIEVMADAVIGTDVDYRVTVWNAAAERVYGFTAEEALGRFARELATYEGDTARHDLEDELDRVGHATTEFTARRKDGTFVEIELVVTAVRDRDGTLTGFLGIHRDVTERRRLELEHRRLSAIVQASSDFIGLCDLEGRAVFLNEAGRQLVGVPADADITGWSILEFFAPRERERVRDELLPELLATGRNKWDLEFCHFERGEPIPVSWDAFRVDDPNTGLPAGLATITRDLRERHAQEAARQRHARRQAAVAALGVRASRGEDARRLMDEAVEVVAQTLDVELVSVEEHPPGSAHPVPRAGHGWSHAPDKPDGGAGDVVVAAVASGEPVVCERLADVGGCHPSPRLSAHGVTSAAVVVIPRRRHERAALAVFSREPRRFEPEEISFLQGIANVLATALTRVEMDRRMAEVREAERQRLARALHDETLQELARAMSLAGGHGEDPAMCDALRRVGAQLRAAVYDLRLADEDRPFADALADTVQVHREIAPELAIELDVRGPLPDLAPDVPVQVLRVLGEALTNARRHAHGRRVDVRVGVAAGELVLTVVDDGRGMSAADPPAPPGRGHGLPGMRERAELLGATLEVVASGAGGTAVTLRVPLPSRDGSPGDPVRVLLVDDHVATREALALAFTEDGGFDVVDQVGTLEEARPLLAGVDVAVIDLELPDGDGADLIAELRAARPSAQALVLSAHVDRARTAHAVDRGAAAVLGKVAHLHEVVSAVRRLRDGGSVMPLDEVVDLLRYAGARRERELREREVADRLTPRELEVLQLMADGLDSHRIAARLHITQRTQRNHVSNILAKVGAHSQLQAVVFGVRHGVVEIHAEAPGDA